MRNYGIYMDNDGYDGFIILVYTSEDHLYIYISISIFLYIYIYMYTYVGLSSVYIYIWENNNNYISRPTSISFFFFWCNGHKHVNHQQLT